MSALWDRANEAFTQVVGSIVNYTGATKQQATIGLVTLGSSVGAYAFWKILAQPGYKLPPGPKPLPLIGNLHNIGRNSKGYLVFDDLKEKYGDMVTIYLGPVRVIILNTADTVRDAYLRDGLNFADRPKFASLELLSNGGKDIIGGEFGPRLQLQRKVALAAIRQYASGKALENHIDGAFKLVSREIEKEKGSFIPIELGYLFAYNIISSMCFGKSFEMDDPFMQTMMKIQVEFEKAFGGPESFFFLLPFMKHFPSKIMKQVKVLSKAIHGFLGGCLEEHMDSYNPDKLSDFTYYMIHSWKEVEQDPNERNKMKLLTQEHFKFILLDLFLAGTETTRQTLAWIWQYLAAFPEVQEKAQQEVDEVIGNGHVGVNCRDQLPYVDAVIHEVMRIMPVTPTGVPRKVINDTKLRGYDIPKGTMIINNTWSIHRDERVWKDPDAFLPERWLDENGQYIFQQNGFLPFSVGRRSCIGESFAKLDLHMLTTLMLQKYTLKPEEGKRIIIEPMDNVGAVRAPDQRIVAEPRR